MTQSVDEEDNKMKNDTAVHPISRESATTIPYHKYLRNDHFIHIRENEREKNKRETKDAFLFATYGLVVCEASSKRNSRIERSIDFHIGLLSYYDQIISIRMM